MIGDAYANALAETINGLYTAELIDKKRSARTRSEVELATLHWVHWFNNRGVLGPIVDIPPAEAERIFWEKAIRPLWRLNLNQKTIGKLWRLSPWTMNNLGAVEIDFLF